MSTVEERLASLEARMDAMTELRALIVDMRNDTNRQFAEVRRDTSELRGDMNSRFDQLNRCVDTIDAKEDRHFTWLVGLQMAVMLSVIGALLGTYFR